MLPPDELMVDTFLPSIRQLVTRRLRSKGYSQAAICSRLGVTQASISLYLSADDDRAYASLAALMMPREEADRLAGVLAEDVERGPLDAQRTFDSAWSALLTEGKACAAHRSRYPSLSGCDICMIGPESLTARRSEAMSLVTEAVGLLESSDTFAAAMPEVSVNLVFAPEGAVTPDDVVGVPGRIVRVKGRAASAMAPKFGASGHLARLLLLVQRRRKDARACVNLRYDARMGKVLARLRLKVVTIGGYPSSAAPDPTVAALTEKMVKGAGGFDAVVDTGGRWIEPNVYLFGTGPKEVAALAVRASKLYSAS